MYDAIEDTLTYADPQTVVALLGPSGHKKLGNIESRRRVFLPGILGQSRTTSIKGKSVKFVSPMKRLPAASTAIP